MDNSAYITLSRQLALFRDMDVTANNIANANTTGFNAEHLLFNSYLTKDENQGVRNNMAFAHNASTYRNTETGTMKPTGNDLDVAIQGEGYFAVETPLGERYTRNGSFKVDSNGTLMTDEGYPVLDNSSQPIALPDNTISVTIGEAGNIKVNGEDFANIGIVQFDNPQLLERLSGTLFKSEVSGQPAQNARVVQGMLENANVQPVLEMTHMIKLNNSVTSTAQFIGIIYELQRKANETWTRQV